MIAPDWIAVDWGTSRLRAWAMTADGNAVAEAASDRGMGSLASDEFEPVLLSLIAPWLGSGTVQVLACGMVGARQGWREVPYTAVPAEPLRLTPVPVDGTDPRIVLSILPGLSQESPPDVMRGEETQIAGLLAERPDFDGVVCLPGTHTKWARISAGEVVSFQTAMTGEMYHLVADHSVIRHVLQGDEPGDRAAFLEAVHDIVSAPERLTQRLFEIRATAVLKNLRPGAARSRLSGVLIGAELAATKPYWLGQEIALVAKGVLEENYRAALTAMGVAPQTYDAGHLTRKGLFAAFATLRELTT